MQNVLTATTYRSPNVNKLTGRQLQYLRQMIELHTLNRGEAIHYSVLAEHLGVSKATAYHMLRILETKGYVAARYDLPEVRVGRSTILYSVTDAGRSLGY